MRAHIDSSIFLYVIHSIKPKIRLTLSKMEINLLDASLKSLIIETVRDNIDELLPRTLTISCIREEIERQYKRSKADLNDYMKQQRNLSHDIKDVFNKTQACFEDIQKLHVCIDDLTSEVKYKAYQIDLIRLQNEVTYLCPLSYAQQLAAEIRSLAKAEDLIKTDETIARVEKELRETFISKIEVNTHIKNIKDEFYRLFHGYAKIEQLDKLYENFQKKIEHNYKVIELHEEENRKDLDNFRLSVEKIETDLKACSTKIEMQSIINLLNSKVSQVDFNELHNQVKPRIDEFQKMLQTFEYTIRQQESVLGRFDEIILDKASKFDVLKISKRLDAVSNHANSEIKIDEIVTKLNLIVAERGEKEEIMRSIQTQIIDISEKLTRRANDSIDIKMIKEKIFEIVNQLSCKIDRSEILKTLEEKAGMKDINSLTYSIEAVHNQIKLLAVQFGTMQKKFTDYSRNDGRSKKDNFYKITQKLVDYIVVSKPTGEESPISNQLKSFIKLPDRLTPELHRNLPDRLTPEPPRMIITPSSRIMTPHRRNYNSFDI